MVEQQLSLLPSQQPLRRSLSMTSPETSLIFVVRRCRVESNDRIFALFWSSFAKMVNLFYNISAGAHPDRLEKEKSVNIENSLVPTGM
jgi:hypothetical protein